MCIRDRFYSGMRAGYDLQIQSAAVFAASDGCGYEQTSLWRGEDVYKRQVMQYVMGHSDAQITMNVYNHIAEKSHVENEMSKICLLYTSRCV